MTRKETLRFEPSFTGFDLTVTMKYSISSSLFIKEQIDNCFHLQHENLLLWISEKQTIKSEILKYKVQ